MKWPPMLLLLENTHQTLKNKNLLKFASQQLLHYPNIFKGKENCKNVHVKKYIYMNINIWSYSTLRLFSYDCALCECFTICFLPQITVNASSCHFTEMRYISCYRSELHFTLCFVNSENSCWLC